jgi:DNA-binding Xre family transcriptional regulator
MKNAAPKARRTRSDEQEPRLEWSRARVVGRGTKTARRYDLKTLRAALGKTQTDIAEAAGMAQGDVSRLERREDVKLSTLARYAAALGGTVQVAVVVNGRCYVLDLTSDTDAGHQAVADGSKARG